MDFDLQHVFPNLTAQQREELRNRFPSMNQWDFIYGNYPDEGFGADEAAIEEENVDADEGDADEGFADADNDEIFDATVLGHYVDWSLQSSWAYGGQKKRKRRRQKVIPDSPSKKAKVEAKGGSRKYHLIRGNMIAYGHEDEEFELMYEFEQFHRKQGLKQPEYNNNKRFIRIPYKNK